MDLKNQKLLKVDLDNNNNNNMGGLGKEDRISKLPDCLLHHILSFLTTEEAFVTSILSKRWMCLFNSIPTLSFGKFRYCNSEDEANTFMNFVDRTLMLRDISKIHTLYIHCYKQCDKSRVNAWITTAIMRQVEELELFIDLKRSNFVIPCSLFTCQSITNLKLFMNSSINLPTSISFPRLKVLHLSFVQFSDEYLTQQLFSNCPVLENLTLSFCRWLNMKRICISAPELKCLVMDSTEAVTDDGIHKCVLNIYAPKLVSLVYTCRIAKDFDLSIFPSLVTAEIECIFEDSYEQQRKKEISYGATKLLKGLSKVRYLMLSGETLEALSFAGDLLVNLPKFNNLLHLDVSPGYNFSIKNALRYLLQISPNLESIVFDEGLHEFFENDWDWLSNEVPQCLLSHLKAIKVGQFKGCEREMNVVQLFIKFAKVLEKLTIVFASSLSGKPRQKIKLMEQLLMFPRASNSCVIDFSSNI